MEIIESIFTNEFNLPASIYFTDKDGLILYSKGENTFDETFIETINATLINIFEDSINKLSTTNRPVKALTINTGDASYYLEPITGIDIYMIVRSKPVTISKITPVLERFIDKIEATLQLTQMEE